MILWRECTTPDAYVKNFQLLITTILWYQLHALSFVILHTTIRTIELLVVSGLVDEDLLSWEGALLDGHCWLFEDEGAQ